MPFDTFIVDLGVPRHTILLFARSGCPPTFISRHHFATMPLPTLRADTGFTGPSISQRLCYNFEPAIETMISRDLLRASRKRISIIISSLFRGPCKSFYIVFFAAAKRHYYGRPPLMMSSLHFINFYYLPRGAQAGFHGRAIWRAK